MRRDASSARSNRLTLGSVRFHRSPRAESGRPAWARSRNAVSSNTIRLPTSMLDSVRKYGEAGQLRLGEVRFSYSVWNLSAK